MVSKVYHSIQNFQVFGYKFYNCSIATMLFLQLLENQLSPLLFSKNEACLNLCWHSSCEPLARHITQSITSKLILNTVHCTVLCCSIWVVKTLAYSDLPHICKILLYIKATTTKQYVCIKIYLIFMWDRLQYICS